MKKVIIDASYLRATACNGHQLRQLVADGFHLVLIDNLFFELCSTDDNRQWLATQRKLYHVANFIEYWRHTGVLLEYEERTQCPIKTPIDKDFTAQFKNLLASKQTYIPEDLYSHVALVSHQRECDSVESLLRACKAHEILSQELKEQIVHQPGDAINSKCQDLVNNENLIKLLIEGDKIFNPELVNDKWIAWHHYKSYIAFLCEYLRLNGTTEFNKLPAETQKKWINRKHDLDYVISLAFADALATNETAGELSRYAKWMYGTSKQLISFKTKVA